MGHYHHHDEEYKIDHLEEEEHNCPGCPAVDISQLPSPLYRIRVAHSSETYVSFFAADQLPDAVVPTLKPGDRVVCPTRYGRDLADVLGVTIAPGHLLEGEPVPIERIANEADLNLFNINAEKERQAFTICQEKIKHHGLDMKLVSTHYLLDEPKVLFFFTAEARVDFRELVKDLVSVFKMRIELRQIGVRDESRVVGGMGVCGRVFCCHGVTDKLKPVSIKMAKEQNISLNSMKISGPCGRLLCCLSYEYDFYHEEKGKLPSEGAKVSHGKELFKVIEINILTRRLRLLSEEGRVVDVSADNFHQEEGTRRWSVTIPEADPE